MHIALWPQVCLRCPMSRFLERIGTRTADLPFGMSPSDVATASTIGWLRTSLPPSQDCHTSKLNKLIASTTWHRQRSNCGGMTLLTSCDGQDRSLLVLEDDGCC